MHEYTQLRMVSAYSKGSEFQFEHERPYDWTEDAACAFQPYSLFELASSDSPIAEGIALEVDPSEVDPKELDEMQAIRELNEENFKKAVEICNSCPVWHECYQDAGEDDFQWTVRAGILPTKFNPTRRGRPLKAVAMDGGPIVLKKVSLVHGAVTGGKYCSKGHCNWRYAKDGKRKCRTCQSEGSNRPPKGRYRIDITQPCRFCDTIAWRKKSSVDGYFCRKCKDDAKKAKAWRDLGKTLNPAERCHKGHQDWLPRKAYGQESWVYYCTPCKEERDTIRS